MRLRTDFDNLDDELKYLQEQLDHWKAYRPHGFISALGRMAKIRSIQKRLEILTSKY